MQSNRVVKSLGGNVHNMGFVYGGFSNLDMQSTEVSTGVENFETFVYDNLHRLTQNTRSYMSVVRADDVINYSYNSIGNITSKSDYANTWSYGNAARNLGGNAGPNAVRSITKLSGTSTSYGYDNNGNMTSGDGRFMTYNEFNKPLSIAKGLVTSRFSYGADLMRYKQIKTGGPEGAVTTYYVDKHLEKEVSSGKTIYRHYIGDIAILNKEVTSVTEWKIAYNHKDRLGSVVSLTDENANIIEHRSYDPFGKPRRGDFINPSEDTIKSAIEDDPHPPVAPADPHTNRGFTDHEHLDEMKIIHMNGRVYDYNLGRFTSVDPFIQGTSSQSINPYSYIMNNPLAGTDPSGYACASDGKVNDCVADMDKGQVETITNAEGETIGFITNNGDGNITATNTQGQSKNFTQNGTGGYDLVQGSSGNIETASGDNTNNQSYSGSDFIKDAANTIRNDIQGVVGGAVDSALEQMNDVVPGYGDAVDLTVDPNSLVEAGDKLSEGDYAGAALAAAMFLCKPCKGAEKLEDLAGTSKKLTKGNGPLPNNGNAKPHGKPPHDNAINDRIENLRNDNSVTNIRKNQQQVDVNGNKVGTNRPDVQYDQCGAHHCVEFDNVPRNSTKHGDRIKLSDPDAKIELNLL